MAERWKEKPRGFATVKRDGFWVKPGAAPVAPAGGRPAAATRSGARNSLVPREWVGSEGLIGNWGKQPRLDPTRFETLKSPETKRWWARPINELTGLDPQTRADVRGFDRETTAQGARIDQSFADFVAQSGQVAQQGNAALSGLAGLVGSGYAGDPMGAVLSEAARKETGAGLAPVMADLSRLPVLARDAGLTASSSFAADRAKTRTETISGYRAAQSEAEQGERDRAAELRGQELEHLGRLAGIEGDLTQAGIRADTATADRTSREGMNDADNATSRANAEARIRAQEAKDAKKAGRKPPTATTIRQWAKRAREMWDGIPRTITGPDGKKTTEYVQYSAVEIVRELQAQGATKARAVRIARLITGNPNIGQGGQLGDLVTGGF